MSHLSRPPRGQQRDKPYREALRMELAAAGEDMKKLREIARVHIARCEAGDMQAIKELADRLDGKPAQMLEHSGPDSEPITKGRERDRACIRDPRADRVQRPNPTVSQPEQKWRQYSLTAFSRSAPRPSFPPKPQSSLDTKRREQRSAMGSLAYQRCEQLDPGMITDRSCHPTLETHLDCPRSFHFVRAVSYPRGGDQS